MFDMGASTAPTLNLLYDMIPLGGYDVHVSTVDGHRHVEVREGSEYVASAQGVLEFTVPETPVDAVISAAVGR